MFHVIADGVVYMRCDTREGAALSVAHLAEDYGVTAVIVEVAP